MKQYVFSTLLMAYAALLLFSCKKDDIKPMIDSQNGPVKISITGEMGEFAPTSKSTAESCIRLKWDTETTDDVYAYGKKTEDGSIELLSETALLATSTDGYTATISGELTSVPADGTLYLVHSPSLTSAPEMTDGSISVSISSQSASVIPFVSYSILTGISNETLTKLSAKFTFASSVLKVNAVDLPSSTAITSAKLSGINTNCTLVFANGNVTVDSDSNGTIIKTLSKTSSASGFTDFFIGVPKMEASTERKLSIITDKGPYIKSSLVKAAHAANSYVNTICSVALPEGALPGVFSISATEKVLFSQGNLQATCTKATDDTPAEYSWGFAENQWDSKKDGKGNSSLSNQAVGDTVDLFGWSTGLTNYGICTSTDIPSYYPRTFKDWGNSIDNNKTWSTLSRDEWTYLFERKGTVDGVDSCCLYSQANVNGVNGIIILPDGIWTSPSKYDHDKIILGYGKGWDIVKKSPYPYNEQQWMEMASAGAIFLPTTSFRSGEKITDNRSNGYYWTSTDTGDSNAARLYFTTSDLKYSNSGGNRCYGYAVRLIYRF